MEKFEVTIREAIPKDAEQLLKVMEQIGGQTSYLVMDEKGMDMNLNELEESLAGLYASKNNVLLLALIEEEIVGVASVKASYQKRVEHIGEVGISILKEYWGCGLGTTLLNEIIGWAEESKVIRRLELTVQERNRRAIHLYRKIGFVSEAVMPRGAKTDDGEFLDVNLMRMLIN